jgi:hypothetical protein
MKHARPVVQVAQLRRRGAHHAQRAHDPEYVADLPMDRQRLLPCVPSRLDVAQQPVHQGQAEQGIRNGSPVAALFQQGPAGEQHVDGFLVPPREPQAKRGVVSRLGHPGFVPELLEHGESLLVPVRQGPLVELPVGETPRRQQRLRLGR